jgi:LacI family transcriptional regulator
MPDFLNELSFLEVKKRPSPAAAKKVLVAFSIPEALRDVLNGMTAFAKQNLCNWQMLCVDLHDLTPNLAHHRADGAITVIRPQSAELIRQVRRRGTPVVNMVHDLHPRLPSVLSDDRAIGRAGAQYLLGRGFRNTAFVGVNMPWSLARHEGFAAATQAAGLPAPIAIKPLAVADFQFVSKMRALTMLRHWVRELTFPVAVMAACDFVARTFIEAALAEGLRVPEDIAVLGVDNFHTICELSPVPISSIAQDFERMGFEAAALLDRLMNDGAPKAEPPVLVPPGRLHVRSSTDVLAFEDPSVLAAIRIIHEHAATGISMKQLMKQVPLSRRWLDEQFRKLVGHTASQEIQRCRMRHVRELLEQTDVPLRQIASRCQFSCTENFIRWFRAGAGISPHAYRLKRRASAPPG